MVLYGALTEHHRSPPSGMGVLLTGPWEMSPVILKVKFSYSSHRKVTCTLTIKLLLDQYHRTSWEFNNSSGNGLVSTGNMPLPEPKFTEIYVAIFITNAPLFRGVEDYVCESPLGDWSFEMNIHNPFMHCVMSQYKLRDAIMLHAVTMVTT